MNKVRAFFVGSRMIGLREFIVFSMVVCPLAIAEPAWKKELSAPGLGPHPRLQSGTLNLNVSWKGMLDSGRLCIRFAPKDVEKPNAYIITSTANSRGLAAELFPFTSHYWSELDPSTLKPRLFNAVETDRKETVTTTTRHSNSRVTCHEITRALPKGASVTTDRTFEFSPVFDIFSAMMHIRSQKLDAGDQINLVVQPFKQPYLVRVKVQGREAHLGRKTIRLTVGMRKIKSKTLELLPYKKMKSDATLWLSDDDDRIPVEFRAAVFIGDVRATLTGFEK